jgi:hypothetical protein
MALSLSDLREGIVDCFLDKKQVNPENAHPSERYNFIVSTKQRISSFL